MESTSRAPCISPCRRKQLVTKTAFLSITSWARDVNSRDRDETETLSFFVDTRPRRDVGASRDRDVETETTSL